MKRGTLILAGAALSLVLGAAAFGFSIVGERQIAPLPQQTARLDVSERTLDEACSSATTYERLKTKLFDVALDVGDVDPAKLDLLAGSTVVRMEDPILKAKDEELGVTVCAGRFVVELPPGAEKAFDGRRRLEAEIEYAAQVAADGSGIVYQLRGAEPITYRLAAFDLQGLPPLPALAPMPALAEVEPILMAPEPESAAIVTSAEVAEAKPVPEMPVIAEAPKIEKAVAAPKVKAHAKAEVKPKPVVKKAEVAKKPDKPKPAVKLASIKPKPAIKVAPPKPKKTEAKVAAAKPKLAKTVVKVAAAKPKPIEAKVKPKPAIRVAAVVPKPAPKPVVKVAKVAVKPKPAPVKVTKSIRTASRNLACGAGRPLSERLMCDNPGLASKERRMMGVYYSALDNANGTTRRALLDSAGDFQAYRNNCRTESCLAGAFDDRVSEIRDILADMR